MTSTSAPTLRESLELLASNSPADRKRGATELRRELVSFAGVMTELPRQDLDDVVQTVVIKLILDCQGRVSAKYPVESGKLAGYFKAMLRNRALTNLRQNSRLAPEEGLAEFVAPEIDVLHDPRAQRAGMEYATEARELLERAAQSVIAGARVDYREGQLRSWTELKARNYENRTLKELINDAGDPFTEKVRNQRYKAHEHFRGYLDRQIEAWREDHTFSTDQADLAKLAISLFVKDNAQVSGDRPAGGLGGKKEKS